MWQCDLLPSGSKLSPSPPSPSLTWIDGSLSFWSGVQAACCRVAFWEVIEGGRYYKLSLQSLELVSWTYHGKCRLSFFFSTRIRLFSDHCHIHFPSYTNIWMPNQFFRVTVTNLKLGRVKLTRWKTPVPVTLYRLGVEGSNNATRLAKYSQGHWKNKMRQP